jgi:hypothetical protein
MAEILEQEEELVLGDDEEVGNLEELSTPPQEPEEELEEKVIEEDKVATHIPDKFKDKSLEDVIHSYEELERAMGRKNNEVGELRKLTDEFLKQSLNSNAGEKQDSAPATLEMDDLLDDPNKAINEAINSNPRLKQLEEQLAEARRAESQKWFESKHPDGQEIVASPEFQDWVSQSIIRQKLLIEANNNYDYNMADELLSTYKELKGVKAKEVSAESKAKREKALKDAAVETGSTGQAPKKIYKRADLMKMMTYNRDAYDDPVFQAELAKAYKEGRVR